MCTYRFQRLKYTKRGAANVFKGFQAPIKAWLMFLETERHLEWCDTQCQKL